MCLSGHFFLVLTGFTCEIMPPFGGGGGGGLMNTMLPCVCGGGGSWVKKPESHPLIFTCEIMPHNFAETDFQTVKTLIRLLL